MSRSNKPRFGTLGKVWKDTVLASRSQKQAWSKTKKQRTRISRRKTAREALKERA